MDYFGEQVLLQEEVWPITVVAESEPLVCVQVPSDTVRQLGLASKLRLPKRRRLLTARTIDYHFHGTSMRLSTALTSPLQGSRQTGDSAAQSGERELLRTALLKCEGLQLVLNGH
jgi:hypothetical protein